MLVFTCLWNIFWPTGIYVTPVYLLICLRLLRGQFFLSVLLPRMVVFLIGGLHFFLQRSQQVHYCIFIWRGNPGITVGFQNLHFQYTFQGINIQCGKNMYVHVAAQWSTASSFRALKQLKRKADCWSKS